MKLETIFAALANTNRLRCLHLVLEYDEVCVCEILDVLEISQPTISKALAALKEAGFLQDRRDANWNYYRRSEAMPAWQSRIMDAALDEMRENAEFQADLDRFVRRMKHARE